MTENSKAPERSTDVSAETLERAISGDEAARTAVLEANFSYVRRLIARLVGQTPELDDLQQVAMIQILTSLHGYHRTSSLQTWIGGICTNVARNYLRKKKVRAVLVLDDAHILQALDPKRPEDLADIRLQLLACQDAISRLSANERIAFMLRVVDGYTVEEVASIMGSAVSTTRFRLYSARKTVAKALVILEKAQSREKRRLAPRLRTGLDLESHAPEREEP